MARRTIGWLVAVAATTVVVGCGGERDAGFADVTNRTCQEVSAAAEALREALVRGPGDDEAAAVRSAVSAYASTVGAAAEQMEDASPRKAEREFQQQAVTRLKQHAAALRAAAKADRHGKLRAEAVEKLSTAGSAGPLIPPAVLDGAPACAGAAR